MKRIFAFFLFVLCVATLSVSSLAADKSSLGTLLNEVYDPTQYTTETYQRYQKAVDRGIAVYENDDATQEQIDEVTTELKNAKNELIPLLNRDLLLEYVDDIEDFLYGTTYNISEETATILTDARKEFLSLYDNINLTKEQLNNAEKKHKDVIEIAQKSKEVQKFSSKEAGNDVVIPEKVISSSQGLGKVTAIRLTLLGIGIAGILLGVTAAILYLKPPKFLQ